MSPFPTEVRYWRSAAAFSLSGVIRPQARDPVPNRVGIGLMRIILSVISLGMRHSISVTLDGWCDHRVTLAAEDSHLHTVENLRPSRCPANSHKLRGIDELKKVKAGEGPDMVLWGSSTLYPPLLEANLIDRLSSAPSYWAKVRSCSAMQAIPSP